MMSERMDRRAAPGGSGAAASGSALPIEAFGEDARSLTPEQFEARHGSGFLMVTASGIGGRRGTSGTELLLEVDDDPAARTANVSVVVYPLRQKAGAQGHLVTIGRETGHDVVIPDPSVSRFHAFAKPGPGGAFLLQDMGSTNGTSVNGASVAPRDAGPATPIKPGDTVRLGQVEFTFSNARALQEYAQQLGG